MFPFLLPPGIGNRGRVTGTCVSLNTLVIDKLAADSREEAVVAPWLVHFGWLWTMWRVN